MRDEGEELGDEKKIHHRGTEGTKGVKMECSPYTFPVLEWFPDRDSSIRAASRLHSPACP